MLFLSFGSIRRTGQCFGLRSRFHRSPHGPHEIARPKGEAFVDLPEVPEVSQSFMHDMSLIFTDRVVDASDVTRIQSTTAVTSFTENKEKRFLLESSIIRKQYPDSHEPGNANDCCRRAEEVRNSLSLDLSAHQDVTIEQNAHTDNSIIQNESTQRPASPTQPSQDQRMSTGFFPPDAARSSNMRTHTRSVSNEASDANFFSCPEASIYQDMRTHVINTATTAAADASYVIHDQSEVLDEEDEDNPQASSSSVTQGAVQSFLPVASEDRPEIVKVDRCMPKPASLISPSEEPRALPETRSAYHSAWRTPPTTTPTVKRPAPETARQTTSGYLEPSPRNQSWNADAFVDGNKGSISGSLARAAAAVSTEPRPAPEKRQANPPRPSVIPIRGPSGLPQYTSYRKAISFCSRNVPKALRYEGIMATIDKKKAAKARYWGTMQGENEMWQSHLAERHSKMGPQPWDSDGDGDGDGDDDQDQDEQIFGASARPIRTQKWVQARLYGRLKRQCPGIGESYRDKLAAIETNVDAEDRAYQETLQTTFVLEWTSAAAQKRNQTQRLEEIRVEISRVEQELTSLEKGISDPDADDRLEQTAEQMRQTTCPDEEPARRILSGIVSGLTDENTHSQLRTAEEWSSLRRDMRALWAEQEAKRFKMVQLRNEMMDLFERERSLRRAGMSGMSQGFLDAEKANFGETRLQPGECWVNYKEKYRVRCPVRLDSDDENRCWRMQEE